MLSSTAALEMTRCKYEAQNAKQNVTLAHKIKKTQADQVLMRLKGCHIVYRTVDVHGELLSWRPLTQFAAIAVLTTNRRGYSDTICA